jgi:hypothetical protein
MADIILKIIILITLIFIFVKITNLDKDLRLRLKVSTLLFSIAIIYSLLIYFLMPSITPIILNSAKEKYQFWLEVIKAPENILILLALLNLLAVVRDKQFYKKNQQ